MHPSPLQQLQTLLQALEDEWLRVTPIAVTVRQALEDRGEALRNDHIAFRTFDDPRIDIDTLAAPFLAAGFIESGRYVFDEKMLLATSFRPPASAPSLPHVFISALDRRRAPAALNDLVDAVVATLPQDLPADALTRGIQLLTGAALLPRVASSTYRALADRSEYAAWVGAFGIRANHFTVDVNALTTFADLSALNAWLLAQGIALNGAAPYIQGGPEVYLAQSSTKASTIPWTFADGENQSIPSCYIEFAQRYTLADGERFAGFVEKSADKIFESTFEIRGEGGNDPSSPVPEPPCNVPIVKTKSMKP